MTYASNNRRYDPAALVGALGIPAAFGALLVAGLAVKVAIAPEDPGLEGFTIRPVPIPPPPAPPEPPKASSKASAASSTVTRPTDIAIDFAIADPVIALPGAGEIVFPEPGPIDFGLPEPAPSASPFDPVGAKPRGNPGRWVTDSDYRTRWINEGLSGTARFTLSIDARGAVTGCAITRSTGHAVLDQATCDLVGKRARFDAARDASGKPVTGSYTGTITWKIPD